MTNVGNNIKKYRLQKNMKQEELAEKIFVSRQTISNYENNKSKPDIEMLVKIAEILEVDINTLVSGDKEEDEHQLKLQKQMKTFFFILVVEIMLYAIYVYIKRYWDIAEMDSLSRQIVSELKWLFLFSVYPVLCVSLGYHFTQLMLVMKKREDVKWKGKCLVRALTLLLIVGHQIMELENRVIGAIGIIDLWKWQERTQGGPGYWCWPPDEWMNLPTLGKLYNKLFPWMSGMNYFYIELFAIVCVALGIGLRLSKKEVDSHLTS